MGFGGREGGLDNFWVSTNLNIRILGFGSQDRTIWFNLLVFFYKF
jgi:hypothetical protein